MGFRVWGSGVQGFSRFWTKVSLDETVFEWKCQNWMKVFRMKVFLVFLDESVFGRFFFFKMDESVPNRMGDRKNSPTRMGEGVFENSVDFTFRLRSRPGPAQTCVVFFHPISEENRSRRVTLLGFQKSTCRTSDSERREYVMAFRWLQFRSKSASFRAIVAVRLVSGHCCVPGVAVGSKLQTCLLWF